MAVSKECNQFVKRLLEWLCHFTTRNKGPFSLHFLEYLMSFFLNKNNFILNKIK